MANKPESNEKEAMQRSHRRWAVILILAGLQASGCTHKSDMPSQSKPAKTEVVQGTDLSRVTLSPKAAERLDIKTAPVREEQVGSRKRLVGGEVVAKPAAAAGDGSKVWVRVPLSPGDLRAVASGQPARILLLAREADGKAGTTARAVKSDAKETAELHYAVDSATGLAPGQRVRVELALSGAGTRKVVPHAAVLYDAKGKAWVYTNPESLVFVRHAVSVDYVDGDRVVLSDGPATGTAVVTVGAAELLGTEYGRK
jgi:hypothetical protein